MIELNKEKVSQINLAKKEKNAKRFLCVILALIIIFIGVVCVTVKKKNDNIANQGTTAAPSGSTAPGVSATVSSAATDSTTPTDTTVNVTVLAPGTIDNPTIITIDEENWHLTLVNSCYRIPEDYEPNLVYVCNSEERLDVNVAEKYEEMYNAGLEDGVTLTPCSGYRSYELQERNYNNKIAFYESQGYTNEEAIAEASKIIMPPGSSEHNLGYAMDIVCVDEWFEDTEEFKWLTENAADYGFIMRYPEDKQDVTNVIYEPWHWRYVGVELAQELKSSGLVLEEYLGVTVQ